MFRSLQKKFLHLLIVCALTSSLIIPTAQAAPDENSLLEVIDYLSQEHLSGTTKAKLIEAALQAAVTKLNDPYTEYFTDDEWGDFEDALEQSYVGIGVRLEEQNGKFIIVEVFEASPANAAGLRANDQIVTVNATAISKLSLDDLLSKIKGQAGSTVKIGVMRGTQKLIVEMKRAKVHAPVVTTANYNKIGYIDVSSFSTDAGIQFSNKLKTLESQKIKGLVIDLRNNGGGILEVARNIASQFIKQGILIYTRDRNNNRQPMRIENGTSKPYPIVVLVNEWSASASEVLAGALKDYQIAKVVGKNTFGKGSVQDVLQLENGGFLKITTQEYLTPKMNKVNKVGIKPDRIVDNMSAQLVNALRMAGTSSFVMTFQTNDTYVINGVKGSDQVPLYDAKRTNYVHAELLSAFTGATVAPNEKGQLTFTNSGPGTTMTLPKWSVLYQDKQWYVDWSALSNKFPGVKWSKVNGAWQLSYQKAG